MSYPSRFTPEELHARKKAQALARYYKRHEANKAKQKARWHARIAAMSPDELESFRAANNARNQDWRLDNPETYKDSKQASDKKYHETNREHLLAQMRERYQARMAAMTPEELEAHLARKNISTKRYHEAHKAEISAKKTSPESRKREAEQARARRAANPERNRAYHRAYYAANSEKEIAKQLAYAKRNPEKVNTIVARRHARIRQVAINDVTPEQRQAVLDAARGVCVYCPHYNPTCKQCPKGTHKLTIDHITAVVNHGNNTLHNLVACCRSCNSRKRLSPNPVPVQPLLL